MKGTGIVRRLDELGRITLPIELRRTLDIGERDPLEIYTDEGRIILQKYEPADIFTGTKEGLIDFHDKKISKETIIELAKLAGIIE
ncbi:MAG TPA: AbrB/MazE/SpoVT family DNA-binding domain-containing protein [Mobilitalea sp.]|nr:AbrB/MazE/SpoVT family DNA-binding domain-containing protein [Mobilitalea sp.]